MWARNKLELQIRFMNEKKLEISHTSYFLINEQGNKISSRIAKKDLFYNDLVKSCDIGLSTVVVKTKFLRSNNLKFSSLSTKEDYILWLKLIKKIKIIKGLNKKLTFYRKRNNSLSSNKILSFINGYKVYRNHLKFGIIKSLLSLTILAFYSFKKKIFYDFLKYN